jgi:hypothetical protein
MDTTVSYMLTIQFDPNPQAIFGPAGNRENMSIARVRPLLHPDLCRLG